MEIQPVLRDSDVYKIEKILKRRKSGKKTEYFVKWKGYDDDFNSWVTDIFEI